MPSFWNWSYLAAGVFALSACGSSGDGGGDSDNATAPDQAPTAAVIPGTSAAREYLSQFIKDDPDACFREVRLKRPELEGRSGGLSGLGTPLKRVVVLIDGSGSMAARIGGRTKLELAREAALAFVDGLPPEVEASLLVFGQQGDNSEAGKARSCAGVDTLIPMTADRARLRSSVARIRAVGWTPLAAALSRGQALLERSDTPGEQVIYVVSDGEETCGGDPVSVARRINGGETRAIVNIIGFGLPPGEAAALQSVAQAGGGAFVNLATEQAIDRTLSEVREANRIAANALKASDAGSGNALRTADAVTDASSCISNIISSESLRLSDDDSARALEGRILPFAQEAKALMRQRHEALQAREAAFRARLMGEDRQARDQIDRSAAAAGP